MKRASRIYGAPTGNAAFNEWRTAELARLDEERRKLDEAQREFAEYSTRSAAPRTARSSTGSWPNAGPVPAGGGSNAN